MVGSTQTRGDCYYQCKHACTKIEEYWEDRGYYGVVATPSKVDVPHHPDAFYYIIKSNLVNCAPTEYKTPIPISV